jgi:hypothetical protein
MKKFYVGLALAGVVAYVAALGVGAAQAWTGDTQACAGDCQAGPRAAWDDGPPGMGILSSYEGILDNALAKVLKLSVSEIQSARNDGTTWAELADQQGVSVDDLQAAISDAHQAMIDQALEDGVITQAQADAMSAHLEAGPGFGFQNHTGGMPRGGMQGPAFGGGGGFGRR